MRILRNAILHRGMTQIAVGVAAANTTKDSITFKTLHRDCGTPIKQEKVCVTCHTPLTQDDLVSGYEVAKGKFVAFEKDEIEATSTEHDIYIPIVKTIRDLSFDPLWVKKSYWLVPGVASLSYRLLWAAMAAENLVALGVSRLFSEHPCVIEPVNENRLMLHMLSTTPEMVLPDFDVPDLDLNDARTQAELDMAQKAVLSWMQEVSTDDLQSEPDRLKRELIRAKVEDREFVGPEPIELPEPPDDILEALRLSIDEGVPA